MTAHGFLLATLLTAAHCFLPARPPPFANRAARPPATVLSARATSRRSALAGIAAGGGLALTGGGSAALADEPRWTEAASRLGTDARPSTRFVDKDLGWGIDFPRRWKRTQPFGAAPQSGARFVALDFGSQAVVAVSASPPGSVNGSSWEAMGGAQAVASRLLAEHDDEFMAAVQGKSKLTAAAAQTDSRLEFEGKTYIETSGVVGGLPIVRRVRACALLLPAASAGGAPGLLTAWVSAPAEVLSADATATADAAAIISSFRTEAITTAGRDGAGGTGAAWPPAPPKAEAPRPSQVQVFCPGSFPSYVRLSGPGGCQAAY